MSLGIASLHKILKDETRQKIILLLNEKGSLTYTDLMDSLEVISTGLLNYHLKVLGDLLSKNEEEKYILSEKGKLASRLLLQFPEDNQVGKKPRWWRKFWIAHGIFDSAFFIFNIVMYFTGYIDTRALYQLTIVIFAGIGIGYMITHVTKDVLSEKGLRKMSRGMYLLLGTVVLGFVLWVALTIFMNHTGIRRALDEIIGDGALAVISLIICYIVGGFIGDWIGKKTNYHFPWSIGM